MEKGHAIKQYGLLGKNIDYSFSRGYFASKFKKEDKKNCRYDNFDLQNIDEIPALLKRNDLSGLNVTIPYKQEVIQHLDKLSPQARAVGAVNTIRWDPTGKTTGHNTDVFGFEKSLMENLIKFPKYALILGNGGAAAAVAYVLKNNNCRFKIVSRTPQKGQLSYNQLDEKIIRNHTLIVNTTPLGTFPKVEYFPPIPYQHITDKHLLFDLIYNPEETTFLKKGKERGATVKNGYKMLVYQAEKAWELWNA